MDLGMFGHRGVRIEVFVWRQPSDLADGATTSQRLPSHIAWRGQCCPLPPRVTLH